MLLFRDWAVLNNSISKRDQDTEAESSSVVKEALPTYGYNNSELAKMYIESLKEQKRILEVQNDFLRRNFEVSLNSIAEGQHASFAQLRALGWYQAVLANDGDEKKAEAAIAAMSNKAAWFAGITVQAGKTEEAGKKRRQ